MSVRWQHRLCSPPSCPTRVCHRAEELEIGGEAAGCQALAVQFTQKPQDGSADAVLDIVLTPSYVYYSGDQSGSSVPLAVLTELRVGACAGGGQRDGQGGRARGLPAHRRQQRQRRRGCRAAAGLTRTPRLSTTLQPALSTESWRSSRPLSSSISATSALRPPPRWGWEAGVPCSGAAHANAHAGCAWCC